MWYWGNTNDYLNPKIGSIDFRFQDALLKIVRTQDALKPVAEEWASELSLEQRGERVKVAGSVVYGMRRYERGATLAAHIDQKDTHIISAILNIAQVGKQIKAQKMVLKYRCLSGR